jgi:predicted MFS family arabinose efflux permease
MLVVPLGDVLDRRRLIPQVYLVCAVALLGVALAPSFAVLLVASALVGLTTVAAQLLGPLASELADPAQRGRVVGAVVSGALIGILLSRTISGVIAEAFGWRAIYVLAAAAALAFAVVLRRSIPVLPPRPPIAYSVLLRSVFVTVRRLPAAQATLVISAINFGVFSLFWTALTFLLSEPPFSYSTSTIGLVGLAGLAGALGARRAGNLHDRGWSIPANGAALLLILGSLVLAGLGGRSIVVLLIAIVLLDVAVQTVTVLSQTRLFAVAADARSRLNTALVVSNFIGAAIGSALAAVLWQAGGWTAVMTGAALAIGVALIAWLVTRRGALVLPASGADEPAPGAPAPTEPETDTHSPVGDARSLTPQGIRSTT